MPKAQVREALTAARRNQVLANARKSACWGRCDTAAYQSACADAEYWARKIRHLSGRTGRGD